MTIEEIKKRVESDKKEKILDRRIFERKNVELNVFIMYWSTRIPCKIINIDKNGVAFLINKFDFGDVMNLHYGAELKFELKDDVEKYELTKDYEIPVYTCFFVHLEETEDSRVVLGAVTESDLFDRLTKIIDI